MSRSSLHFQPIGVVANGIKKTLAPDQIKAVPSRIILEPNLVPGLKGLAAGQKILIVFYFHLSDGPPDLQQHPKRDRSRPKRGVFALRSPQRPNRIGITTVELLAINRNVLHVKNLDAVDGTPVLDIKPT